MKMSVQRPGTLQTHYAYDRTRGQRLQVVAWNSSNSFDPLSPTHPSSKGQQRRKRGGAAKNKTREGGRERERTYGRLFGIFV